MFSSSFSLFLLFTLPSLFPADQVPIQLPPSPRFPWIHKFASIGDSYAAGLGAGTRVDWGCSRYSSSYPYILHTSLLGSDANRTHVALSCSGASTSMILETQVPQLQNSSLDLLTVSAGGNDIGLTPVLSNCVYQFCLNSEADCDNAIHDAQTSIDDPNVLLKNVGNVIEAAKPKMNDQGMIVLTGYARFFGVEDELCDQVSWAVWNVGGYKKEYLSVQMRRRLNGLVLSVNQVLKKAAEAAGPRVLFVDYDAEIEAIRGRYCESGVIEPAPNREGLAFYEWNTVDDGENTTELQQHSGDNVPRGSFEAGIAERISKTLAEHPDWVFDPDMGFVNKDRVGEEGIIGDISDGIHWLLPDSYKRVFHMRPEGHKVVANEVVDRLERYKNFGLMRFGEGFIRGRVMWIAWVIGWIVVSFAIW